MTQERTAKFVPPRRAPQFKRGGHRPPRFKNCSAGPVKPLNFGPQLPPETRISNKSSTDSRISQSNYRNLADRRQKMLSLGDPYFRSLDFSNIYSFEFFPWYHNSLAFNVTTHNNRWKSEMRAVAKVVFAFRLVTAFFSFSNNWHKHISHLKLAEQSKWPYN